MSEDKRSIEDFTFEELIRFPAILIEKYKTGRIQYKLDRYNLILEIDTISKSTGEAILYYDGSGSKYVNDGTHKLLLYYEKILLSVITFNIKPIILRNTLEIVQIQNCFYRDSYLDPFDRTIFDTSNHYLNGFEWRKVMIEVLERYAKRTKKIKKIKINSSIHVNHDGHIKTTDQLYKSYDQTALDMGYVGNPKKDYIKILK